jgi:hypothetical protein
MDSGRSADVSAHDSCVVCWASVPRTLMHFHREWHLDQEQRLADAIALTLRQVPPPRNSLRGDAVLGACPPES